MNKVAYYEEIILDDILEKEAGFFQSTKTPEQLAPKILKRSRVSNLENWGSNPNQNALFVTGYSGSGKSTVAKGLAGKNTNIIHLDNFLEKADSNTARSFQDKDFVKYLNKKFPEYTQASNTSIDRKERWKHIDRLADNIVDFSKQQHQKGKKVIVEGVQLSDETIYPKKDFFKDKPIVLVKTNPVLSILRAAKRDGKRIGFGDIGEYYNWVKLSNKNMKDIAKLTGAKKYSPKLKQ